MAKPSLVQPLSHTDACQARVAAPSIRFCVLVQLQIALFDPAQLALDLAEENAQDSGQNKTDVFSSEKSMK